ncbi:MAG: autophagy protein atg9 [Caeruleum heppii]|nr:MAG: autophagy protein atg9 [Caeruleum heppii]
MTSNLISRFLPPREGSPSVYETFRHHDESSDASDLEERAGMAVDEENLETDFRDYELDQVAAEGIDDSHFNTESTAFLGANDRPRQGQDTRPGHTRGKRTGGSHWISPLHRPQDAEDGDDEVPQSLLVEGTEDLLPTHGQSRSAGPSDAQTGSPSTPHTAPQADRAYSQRTRPIRRPDERSPARASRTSREPRPRTGLIMADPREKALWRWANVQNLDNFLKDVYEYFLGNGIWSIMLSRALNLLTLSFVIGFSTFLTVCIDYKKIPMSKSMSEVVIPQCTKNMSGTANVMLWLFAFFWVAKVFQYAMDIRRLRHLHDFYHHLLEVSDADIQTISWQEIVARLMSLRDANPVTAEDIGPRNRRFIGHQSKQRMDAHDIANRLMRKENYLIALFNKDILDLTLPIPFLRNRELFSKTLEWNLSLCILDYVFNEQGQVRPLFLKDTHRRALSDGLRRRFLFAGAMNVVCAPFIIIYLMMLYFFRYFTEYQKNPSQLGSRQYSPLAEWKFREFNELWHLFQRRINMSYPFASRYVDQFPKDKTIQVLRFVAFVTGALAAVLALASIFDPELFLGFEITRDRTVLFYLGVFGTVWAASRGAVPEENLVFDPEYALKEVTAYTHYMPARWNGRLHSNEVKREFSVLYQMKVVIFIEEILSIIFTPFVLWFSLPKCSDRLVDFFREFTVHVDGLGYVCSFAVFDFKKAGGNEAPQSPVRDAGHGLRDEYYSTKDGKMLASYFGFLDNYATNPRSKTAQSMHAQRPFHPPPAFQGLMSPTLAAERGAVGASRSGRPGAVAARASGSQWGGPALRKKHQSPPSAFQRGSLMASALLDPHHQPPLSRPVPAVRAGPSSRQRMEGQRLVEEEAAEDERDSLPAQAQGAGPTSSGSAGAIGDDGGLADSWKTTHPGTRSEEERADEVGERAGEGDAGVLGLLYQFQKAQTAGRGAGMNI